MTRRQIQHAVVAVKPSGAKVVFSLHDEERAADLVVERLKSFGLPSHIQRVRPHTVAPGSTIK